MASNWTDWTKYQWGIDVSHYRPSIDWNLLKAADIGFVIAKASEGTDLLDDTFADHCQRTYDIDVPFMGYHFMDPVYYSVYKPAATPPAADAQLQNFLKALKNKRVYATMLDHERWWESYDQWNQARRGEITWAQVKACDPYWVSESTHELSNRVIKAVGLPHIIYSSKSFIDGYAPKTKEWVDNFMQHTAYYPYTTTVVAVNSWQEFFDKYMPPYPLRYGNEDHATPPWWANRAPSFWQFTGDKFQMPGVQDGRKINLTTDINLFYGSRDDLYRTLGFKPNGTVTPPPSTGGGSTPDQTPDPVAMNEVLAMLKELKVTVDTVGQNVQATKNSTDEIRAHFA